MSLLSLEKICGLLYNHYMKNLTLEKQINQCFDSLAPFGAVKNAPMCEHTSFKIGGSADILFIPKSVDELLFALNCSVQCDIPVFVMGNGSNLLVHDDGIRGLVIKLRESEPEIRFNTDTATMTVSAAAQFSFAAKRSVDAGYMGLEWGAGIPGTVGGAVAMNAGAYGGEIKDCITAVGAIIQENGMYVKKTFITHSSEFGYRVSPYGFPTCIVTEAEFKLQKDDGKTRERMEYYNKQRTAKQPLSYPSAGSVFKRPEGHYAGALIEEAGLKGRRVGGAQVSELHAGFIINIGGATASDVCQLIDIIKRTVFETSGVMLTEELRIIGG